jgi:uncharacterized protein YecE (DUF72 family)
LIYAGTSGFSYTAWRGVFYPSKLPGARMLSFYAERLNGVELNGTFYRMPPAETIVKWLSETPDGFRFCLKAQRGLTYSAAGFDKESLAAAIGTRLRELGPRAGPVLVQWPPTRQRDVTLLDTVLAALGLPAAVEARHESWFHPDVYRVLDRHGAALVRTDEEKWPLAPRMESSGIAYYRLRRDYDAAGLDRWRRELRAEAASREALHVFFKHEPEAPARALHMLG